MFKTSVIEISESAFRNNLNFVKSVIGQDCRFSSVIKGNAYGHGISVFVPLAENCGVNHFSVFSADEALETGRASNGQSTIMIMGMIDAPEIAWAIENNIEFYVFDVARLKQALEASIKLKKPARIHLEIETGMNRTGLAKEELLEALGIIGQNPSCFLVKGMCTHYAGAESIANYVRVKKQIINYNSIYNHCLKENVRPGIRHSACSAAMISYPASRMDLVRIGIIQYGFWPSKETLITYLSKETEKKDPLKRLITWKSRVMSTKSVSSGEFIGYGTSFLADTDMKVASIPVGYSHGYSRMLSNQGSVLIKGHCVRTIGIVNMNMILIDISHVPNVEPGEEVILIGQQGDLNISFSSFTELSNQLNYEVLARLPQDIPRRIVA